MFYNNHNSKDVALFLIIVCATVSNAIIIETSYDQTDQQCDFYNQTLVDKIWFVRSPFNCRVYHLCAFYKQVNYRFD